MSFSYWNLLVVLCFVILYLGVALVFVQLRRFRDEMHQLAALNAAANKENDESRNCAEVILRRLTSFELNMTTTLEAIPIQLKADLETIQGELRFLAQPQTSPAVAQPPAESQSSMRGGGTNTDSDSYREARLLLANGVDEERVVNETGLTVEEVSLLKRMTNTSVSEDE
ncbi:MAG: hypothetical protein HQL69_05875 [Magnetococcales bacterium]|nr:hypothetical protein [Magnetococcales bacterium]